MADESAPVTEITAESVQQTAAEQAAPATNDEGGEGTHYIDFDKLPPEVHARFKRLYKHTKDSERRETLMAQELRRAHDAIEELRVNVTNDKKKDVLTDLKAQKVAALETGDYKRVTDIDERIGEVQAMRVQPKRVETPRQAESAIPDEDGAAFEEWSEETNSDGSVKRPWAANTKHPMHEEAALIGASVFRSKKFADSSTEEKLAEIDRRMAIATGQADRATASVLSTNNGSRQPGKKPGLSADEKRIAERMYESMPAAKAHERYLASKQNVYGARA